MIKVLVADDHAVVREGLKQIIRENGMAVTAEATSGQETLEKAREHEWDVLVLDMTMPNLSGLELLKAIKHEYPHRPVLVLSIHPEDQYAVRVLKAGAAGYLMKDSAPAELVGALQKVVSGGKYVAPTLAEKILWDLATSTSQPLHATLSDREFQVLRLMATGKTMTEIAEELSLSVKTVSTYRARLLEKLNLKTNAEAIRYAFQHHLAE